MSTTATHYVGPNGGHTKTKGQPIKVRCHWEASAFFVLPTGAKHVHAITVPNATLMDMVPLMSERFGDLIAEHGNEVSGAGWMRDAEETKKKPLISAALHQSRIAHRRKNNAHRN
jgi:hypothetical protein